MFDVFLYTLTAMAGGTILYYTARKQLLRRIEVMEEDLERYAEVIAKMAEVQSRTFEKFSGRFEELEERVLDLSIPSQDPELPLEKRHQVLSLAKQGVSLEEIVERVKAPVGEAELILNLRKYQRGMMKNTAAPKQAAAHA
ncbi:MAG: DUF2802 domain-containing protein [Acidobacteriota bacterium]|jgi:hypothetical protein|nr:DUF2802 domain-containing protein [Acidobacteriota bacterium]